MSAGPKLSDVAAAAGVHASTASRALDPDLSGRLSPEVVRRVRQVAEELGYSRNGIAASLRTRRSRTVGVIVSDLSNTMFPPMFRGIEERLSAEGYSALLGSADFRAEKEKAIIATFLDRRIDGMILSSAQLDDARALRALARKVPIVLLNRETLDMSVTAVLSDEVRGITAAFDHLHGLGHRRIAHLAGPQNLSTGVARREAFLGAAQREGLEVPDRWVKVAQAFTEAEGRRVAAELMAQGGPLPTAVVAANDWLAIGLMRALETQGLVCPRDISITGYNDMPFVDLLRPPLTTVHIPHVHMGREAADQLLASIAMPDRPARRVVMAPELVVRGTTAPPRADA